MGKAVGVVVEAVDILPDMKQIQANIDLLEQITQYLPEFATYDSMKDLHDKTQTDQYQRIVGPALRALHTFLIEVDPGQLWGGLYKTPTPDGNILWAAPHFFTQHLHGGLDPCMYISITDDGSEFVIPFGEHAT